LTGRQLSRKSPSWAIADQRVRLAAGGVLYRFFNSGLLDPNPFALKGTSGSELNCKRQTTINLQTQADLTNWSSTLLSYLFKNQNENVRLGLVIE
jgi:hypothetical protein